MAEIALGAHRACCPGQQGRSQTAVLGMRRAHCSKGMAFESMHQWLLELQLVRRKYSHLECRDREVVSLQSDPRAVGWREAPTESIDKLGTRKVVLACLRGWCV